MSLDTCFLRIHKLIILFSTLATLPEVSCYTLKVLTNFFFHVCSSSWSQGEHDFNEWLWCNYLVFKFLASNSGEKIFSCKNVVVFMQNIHTSLPYIEWWCISCLSIERSIGMKHFIYMCIQTFLILRHACFLIFLGHWRSLRRSELFWGRKRTLYLSALVLRSRFQMFQFLWGTF